MCRQKLSTGSEEPPERLGRSGAETECAQHIPPKNAPLARLDAQTGVMG
jgi:hypothetical protein